jgi:hypothetical protein
MDRAMRKLNELNPDIDMLSIEDTSFLRYGRVHHERPVDVLLASLDGKPGSGTGVLRSINDRHDACPVELARTLREIFGRTELQVESVQGRNARLDALEYHKCVEVVVAGTDMVALMGLVCDIVWPAGTFDVSRTRAFYVPRGTVYEVFPWCLHSTPVHVHEAEGFRCIVIQPRGAHAPVDFTPDPGGEGKLMRGRNTWLISYVNESGVPGASTHRGLKGRVIELKTL